MAIKNKYVLEFNSKGVKKTKSDVDGLDKSQSKLAKNSKKIKAGLAAVGVAIAAMGTYAISTAAQFEKLRTRLNTMYGSVNRGTKAFQTFNKIAATTPFAVKNVVEAGASLKAFGMDAEKNIKGVADLAAFMGVDVVEAAQAMGRAFAGGAGAADVLRERGVLELIKSFKGVDDLTKLTLPEFREALEEAITDPTLGIAGATTALSETFDGAYSNMMDSVDRLAAHMGNKLLPTAKSVVQGMTGFINSMISSKDATTENMSAVIGEQTKLNLLVSTITSANTKQEMRVKLIQDLQREYPDFLKNLNAEKVSNEDLKDALHDANLTYERRLELVLLEGRANLIRERMSKLQSDQATTTNEYSDAILSVAGELNHVIAVMKAYNRGEGGWQDFMAGMEGSMGDVRMITGEGIANVTSFFNALFEGSDRIRGENPFVTSLNFDDVIDINEEQVRKFIETSDLFENWYGADIWDDKMQDIIASSLKWNKATGSVVLDFEALQKAFKDNEIGSRTYLQMFPLLSAELANIQEEMNGVKEEIDFSENLKNATDSEVWTNFKEAVNESFGDTELPNFLSNIEKIPIVATRGTEEGLKGFAKFHGKFHNFLKDANKDMIGFAGTTIDAMGSIGMAAAKDDKSRLKVQKAMVIGNVAKGIIDIWTSPAPSNPLQTARAVAASAALVAQGVSQRKAIDQQIAEIDSAKGEIGQSGGVTFAQYGMNQVVDGATPIVAGEAGAELVQITPLEGPNVNGPQGSGSIIISGNVLSREFVREELADEIREAIRQGYDFT